MARLKPSNGRMHHTRGLALSTSKTMVSWIIDSGATHHTTWQRDILTDITPIRSPFAFSTAGDYRLEAKERGTVIVRLKNGKTLRINVVNYVPSSRVNLLSTNSMVKHGWDVRLRNYGGAISKGNLSLALTGWRIVACIARYGRPEGEEEPDICAPGSTHREEPLPARRRAQEVRPHRSTKAVGAGRGWTTHWLDPSQGEGRPVQDQRLHGVPTTQDAEDT